MNFKLLKQKDFLLLMLGKLVSLIGTQMQSFALSLYVLKITGSAAKFASVLAITLLPEIILGPIAGVFADWFDRKKIIVYLDILSGIATGVFAIIYKINGGLSLTHVYILVVIMSIISLLFNPAISTVIPTLVKKDELVDANGVNSFIMNFGSLAAPALAGILLGSYGLLVILIVNSISFILSALSEIFINIPKTNSKPEKINIKSFWQDFSQGITFIKNEKLMLNIIILGLIINFVFNPLFTIGLPYICKRMIQITDKQYGLLESISVVAMIIAPFIISIVSKKIKLGKLLFLNIFITSILIAIMAGISSSSYLNLFNSKLVPFISMTCIVFTISLIILIVNIAIGTVLQQKVPLNMMGRVGSVMGTVCMAAIPLGQMIFGFLFDKIEAWICVSIISLTLFTTILIFRKSLCSSDEEKTSTECSIDNEELIISSPELANAIGED